MLCVNNLLNHEQEHGKTNTTSIVFRKIIAETLTSEQSDCEVVYCLDFELDSECSGSDEEDEVS